VKAVPRRNPSEKRESIKGGEGLGTCPVWVYVRKRGFIPLEGGGQSMSGSQKGGEEPPLIAVASKEEEYAIF